MMLKFIPYSDTVSFQCYITLTKSAKYKKNSVNEMSIGHFSRTASKEHAGAYTH